MPAASTSLSENRELRIGFYVSVLIHGIFVWLLIVELDKSSLEFGAPIVYSISLDGGKSLGGRSQVPDKINTPKAPPKNVGTEPQKPQPPLEAVKSEPVKVKPPTDAEISTAKPTPVAKPTKSSSPKPKQTATPKPTPKSVDADREYQKAMQKYLGESSDAGGKGFGAATVGGAGMGGGTQRSAEFIQYYNLLRAHIRREWNWYDAQSRLTARAYFRIDPDGTVKDIRIVEGSGNSEFDSSILRALNKANPVPPPPPKEYQNFKELRMIFDPRDL